jgi:hypothetical protein
MKAYLINTYFSLRHGIRHFRKFVIQVFFNSYGNHQYNSLVKDTIQNIRDFGVAKIDAQSLLYADKAFVNIKEKASLLLSEQSRLNTLSSEVLNKKKSFKITISDEFNYEDLSSLITNTEILNVVRGYLRTEPYLNQAEVWWDKYEPGLEKDSQTFHIDGEDPILLKVFIYLSNVDSKSGPFMYIKKSHKFLNQFFGIMRHGVASLTADNISGSMKKREYEASGNAGDIIFADTNGFHRGKKISKDSNGRILLMLSFVSNWPIKSSRKEPSILPFLSSKELAVRHHSKQNN